MQNYGPLFARAYNLYWSGFVGTIAPFLLEFYGQTPAGRAMKPVLDVGCGTGQLARHFLEQGYPVVGLDLSRDMLRYAGENCRDYLQQGRAMFVQGDATAFAFERRFGLVVSTFDMLNHLPDFEALESCFRSVSAVLEEGGYFIFDLNTRRGLMRWNSIHVNDQGDALLINRGIYDGQGERAYSRITGFLRNDEGLYERFDETFFNTVFEMRAVREALLRLGWREAYAAQVRSLDVAVEEPEALGRVFFVARR